MSKAATMTSSKNNGFYILILCSIILFLIGFTTTLLDILTPEFKRVLNISYKEAHLTQFSFFLAYMIFSLPASAMIFYFGLSEMIAVACCVVAFGCMLFLPAALSLNFLFFLLAIYVVASGVAILQVAANMTICESYADNNASYHLTIAQTFNSLGTTLSPVFASYVFRALFNVVSDVPVLSHMVAKLRSLEIRTTLDFLFVSLGFLAMATWVYLTKNRIPKIKKVVKKQSVTYNFFARPRLYCAVGCIFLYVGSEVTIGTIMVDYIMMNREDGFNVTLAGALVSCYWGSALVGRVLGSVLLRKHQPRNMLMLCAFLAMALILISSLSSGLLSAVTLILVGLANSIMFPLIYSLGLKDVGSYATQASGYLCCAIVGGAVIPLLFGAIADAYTLKTGLFILIMCYAIISWYALNYNKILVTRS